MSAAKKSKSANAAPPWTSRGIFWFFGPGRPVLLTLLVLGGLGGGCYWLWHRVGWLALSSPEYLLEQPAQLQVTPQPEWLDRVDVRTNVFHQLSREGPLNIMDADLTKRIAAAFAQQPWVAKVLAVQKQPAAVVKVDLEYRKPVCAVAVPGVALPLPVDAAAVLLPTDDFTPVQLHRLPILVGVAQIPVELAPGRQWRDARVIGAAELAALLQPVWDEWQLQRIEPSLPAAANGECRFQLVTRGGTPLNWGYPPGAPNAGGEAVAKEKLAWLEHRYNEHDSLDTPNRQPLTIGTLHAATPEEAR